VSWAAALRSALGALRANALRSFLTMLGIIIGVAAVIAMVAVGRGATERVQAQMKGLGSNIMLVLPGGVSQAGVRLGAQTRQRLTEEDAQAIALEIPQVQVAAPTSRTTGQLVWGNANWGSNLIGVNNDYLEARDCRCKAGARLTRPSWPDRPKWDGLARPPRGSCLAPKTRWTRWCGCAGFPSPSSACSAPKARTPWAKTKTMWS